MTESIVPFEAHPIIVEVAENEWVEFCVTSPVFTYRVIPLAL